MSEALFVRFSASACKILKKAVSESHASSGEEERNLSERGMQAEQRMEIKN